MKATNNNNDIIHDKIRAAIGDYNMLGEPENNNASVTVALSGGADSVALLYAMLDLQKEHNITVRACHVNHRLRGAESDKDEEFVRRLCQNLEVELTVRSVDVKSLQKKHQSIEETARSARYSFFAELPGKIATAHTASDNAETIMLNLIRGTGLKGLCGIPPVRGNIIRPLIWCERFEIETFCRNRNLDYVTDSTNFSYEFTRNKVRLSLMPLIKEINPSFDCGITRMCNALREDSDYLENLALSVLRNDGCGVKKLKSLEKPILNRIIIALLSNNNISPSSLRISQIAEIIANECGKINLEKHKFAVIEDETLKIVTIPQFYS